MRKLGSYPNEKAQVFIDYLVAKEMPAQISPAPGGGFDLWIIEEDHYRAAKADFDEFTASPEDAKYRHASKAAEKIREQALERARQYRKNVVKPSGRRSKRQPPIGMALLVICIVVFVLTGFRFDPTSKVVQSLAFMAASWSPELLDLSPWELSTYNLRQGQIWRAITPAFLHMSFWHIIFNMSWLVMLGFNIERREGPTRFIVLVLASAICGNLLQGLMPSTWDGTPVAPTGTGLIVPFGGFSGVAYGLFGFAWMKGTQRFIPEYMMPASTVIIVIGWFMLGVLGLDQELMGVSMANWAHGGGLVMGMLLGSWPETSKRGG